MKKRSINKEKVVGLVMELALWLELILLTRLKDYCPFMVKNHCAAHLVNLSTEDTFKSEAKCTKINETLLKITTFYNEAIIWF